MPSDLTHYIQSTPLIDTHEHLFYEDQFVNNGPDVLADLFGMYIGDELVIAGASQEAVKRLLDPTDPDVPARWAGVEKAWLACQFSGYGEAVRYMAKAVYGIEELTLKSIEGAAARNMEIRKPGGRLHLLRDVANLDHVQVDDFIWSCLPDESGPDFFLYDLSWVAFTDAKFDVNALEAEIGIRVMDLSTLQEAIAALFAKYGPAAIAVKSQHAYDRTLAWQHRDDADAEHVLQQYLSGAALSLADKLCLGDWCLGKGVEQAATFNLPIKIHTGYLAGNSTNYIQPDRVRAAHLAPLLAHYPDANFVLMHIAYPYSDEIISLAKHFPNAYLDMCWAWSINPRHAAEFLRRVIHGMPINKVFAYGGDCFWPTESVGFAMQARRWLDYALQGEVNDGYLTEKQAIQIASRLMQGNQRDLFDFEGTRASIHQQMST